MFPIGCAFVSLGFNAADGHPQGLRTPVRHMVKVKGWSLPKPRSTGPPFQTKSSVVAVMEQVGVLLELDGANVFRVRAYQNASRALASMEEDLLSVVQDGRLVEVKELVKESVA